MSSYLPYTSSLFPYLRSNRVEGIDSFFDNFFEKLSPNVVPKQSFDFAPKVDLHETENKLDVLVEVPGVLKEDLNVDVKDGVLTISGSRKSLLEEANYKEIHSGSFERSLKLGKNYDIDNINVKLHKNGILRIEVPKKSEETKKTIEIKDE